MSSTEIGAADLAPLMERCFLFDAVEEAYDISGITGRIPEWLRGSYYINGPARFERNGQRYKHWLDGDGMVCALHFTENGVRFVSRFIQTRKLKEEEAAGRFLYRGFGTAFPGDLLRRGLMLEPPVNVSAYLWNGKLVAFGEQSLPVELDPVTLETVGDYDFHGRLNDVSPFAAHAKLDPANGNLLNFGIAFSATQPMLNVYEFDPAGNQVRRRRYPLAMQHSNHDFGFTSNHVIFYLSPLVMDFDRFWGDRVSVMEALRWQPEKGSKIFVVPRASRTEQPFEVPVGEGYCLHLINCHEDAGRLKVDVLEMEAPVYDQYQPLPDLFATVSRGRPVRYLIDLESRKLLDRSPMTYDPAPDFPSIDPAFLSRDYNDFWLLGISPCGIPGRKFFDQLGHGSWTNGGVDDLYQSPPGEYLAGEPAFAENPNEPGDGLVMVQHLNPKLDEAAYLLFDASAVHRGPIAKLPLRHKLHPGFHASFYPATALASGPSHKAREVLPRP